MAYATFGCFGFRLMTTILCRVFKIYCSTKFFRVLVILFVKESSGQPIHHGHFFSLFSFCKSLHTIYCSLNEVIRLTAIFDDFVKHV